MGDGIQGVKGLRWKGVLADSPAVLRRLSAAFLMLGCVTAVLTQWGYMGVQFADGSATYPMGLLVPVTMAALFLGTLHGAAAGLVVGVILFLHAHVTPLDYYELAYVTPITSFVATAACGLVLGLLSSYVLQLRRGSGRRMLCMVLSCVVSSCVFSALWAFGCCQLGPEVTATLTPAGVCIQALVDACLMVISWQVAVEHMGSVIREGESAGLRKLFGAWLSMLVLAAFMVIVDVSYVSVTTREIEDANVALRDEAAFLLARVQEAARLDERAEAAGLEEDSQIAGLLEGYSEEFDGLVVATRRGLVIGSDSNQAVLGEGLERVLGADAFAAVQRSIDEDAVEFIAYVAPSAYNDLVALGLPGTEDAFASLSTYQVGYLMAAEDGDYRVIFVHPASMVFANRSSVIGWVSATSLALLLVIYVLTRRLLDRLVAQRIDMTNAVLARITEGDLAARVERGGTSEFDELSEGINQTVDVLKGWIEETERRMDEELETAKAIQESALPGIFPPYPDIKKFDIFAIMNAAKEVGGDFYDFFLVGDDCGPTSGKIAFVMADVCGKGIPASLFMMKAKTQIRDYLESGMELGEAIENANRRLCEGNDENMFVTAWVGVLDYATRHIDYVNAGHNPPLLWHEGSWRFMRELSGLPLGSFDEMEYKAYALDCEVGDQILLYTDGVTEAFSVDLEQYGNARLEALARECFASHPRELVVRLRESVAEHTEGAEQSDDITILALEVGVPPEEKAQLVVGANTSEINLVSNFVRTELDRRLCPLRVQNQLMVALEELFVNVCNYAYEDADESVERYVRVTHSYKAKPRSVTVEIVDDGMPFNPLDECVEGGVGAFADLGNLDIGGLGIMMARKAVDEMRYERVGDSNIVTLVKCW